jgi:hypothetical protein
MIDRELREAIATEAARLILRRKVVEYHAARQRASRWISKRKLSHEEMPSNSEIQAKVEELACLFADEQLTALREASPDEPTDFDVEPEAEAPAEEGYHPDTLPLLGILMNRLDGLRLDPKEHAEGDALYHSLQVFELGLAERPWDEEFLLACLIHDVGLAIDRRKPIDAALNAVGRLVTQRTRFFIEHLPEGVAYLRSGQVSRTLRRSDHFDDLIDLARLDLAGRVAGAEVGTLDEALDYLSGLENAWDGEDEDAM